MRILLVDDNPKFCRAVTEYLEPEGFSVALAHSGGEGLEKALSGQFSAVILDVMLPGLDGFDVLRLIREKSQIPVLMLTGRGDATDRIAGLELGADDYVPKTFSPRELLARLRAVTRRMPTVRQRSIVVGALRIEPDQRGAWMDGRQLGLTPIEFDLLLSLARDCGRVKSRDELMADAADRTIDVHISSLRKKLGDDPRNPYWIHTVRAAGYMLRAVAE